MNKTKVLTGIYDRLFKSFGKQYWWPGDTGFEVVIGAILTQNTNWSNVEKAIKNMKAAKIFTPKNSKNLAIYFFYSKRNTTKPCLSRYFY